MMKPCLTLLGIGLLAAAPAPAALVCYELRLTTDNAFTAFGGGSAGTEFTGFFGFEEGLLASTASVFQPGLDANDFFFVFSVGSSSFASSEAGTLMNSGLYFEGGEVRDVFFDFTNPDGEQLRVSTIVGVEATWTAKEAEDAEEGEEPEEAGGETVPTSVLFVPVPPHLVPEPTIPAMGALAAFLLLAPRRRS